MAQVVDRFVTAISRTAECDAVHHHRSVLLSAASLRIDGASLVDVDAVSVRLAVLNADAKRQGSAHGLGDWTSAEIRTIDVDDGTTSEGVA